MFVNQDAQTEPWLLFFCIIIYVNTYFQRFCCSNDEKNPDHCIKIDGVDFPWKSETVKILCNWMHEGSSACLCSTSDGQPLFGKRRSRYKPGGVDPSSLVKLSGPKKQTPVRGVWTATEAKACITPSITHLAALWDKAWARNQGCLNASLSTVVKGFRVLKLQHSAAQNGLFSKIFSAKDRIFFTFQMLIPRLWLL